MTCVASWMQKGTIRTRGLTWDEMAENLTGRLEVRGKDVSFGGFDPLGTLAQISIGVNSNLYGAR